MCCISKEVTLLRSLVLAKAIAIVVVGNNTDGGTLVGLLGVLFTSRYFLQDVNKASIIKNIISFLIPEIFKL
jgi:hypothetical protein